MMPLSPPAWVQQAGPLLACLAGFDHYPFCNTSLLISDRVDDLVGRIQDADKPAVLTAREIKASLFGPAFPIPVSPVFAVCNSKAHA